MGFGMILPIWLRYVQFVLLLRMMVWNQFLEKIFLDTFRYGSESQIKSHCPT